MRQAGGALTGAAALLLGLGASAFAGEAPGGSAAPLEARIEQLQKQITELRAQMAATARVAARGVDAASPGARRDGLSTLPLGATGAAASRFNPAISVILDGTYYRDNLRGGFFDAQEHARGFINPHDHAEHGHGAIVPGFNLGHSEIHFSATVDPYFDAALNLGVSEHGIEIEEAYGLTRALPAGLQLRFGKFLSGIGYVNRQHRHEWEFVDRPLPYTLMFGEHGLAEKGVQATWLAPTRTYALIGMELLQGENPGMANYEGERDYDTGAARARSGPRMLTAFTRVGPNLGQRHALQAGVFGGRSELHQNLHGSRGEEGRTWFAGTDWVYRYSSGRAYGEGNFKLQAEYLYRERDLRVVGVRAGAEAMHPLGERRLDRQDAIYVQGTYGFAPRWAAGLRWERAGMTNEPGQRSNLPAGVSWAPSERVTGALTWMPTEFSRVRLQVAQARLADDNFGGRERINQVFLQYQLALGVHGAHGF